MLSVKSIEPSCRTFEESAQYCAEGWFSNACDLSLQEVREAVITAVKIIKKIMH